MGGKGKKVRVVPCARERAMGEVDARSRSNVSSREKCALLAPLQLTRHHARQLAASVITDLRWIFEENERM